MGSNRTLANLSVRSSPLLHMFSNSTGKLRRQLRKGEFALFKHVPVFESDFIQISKRGHVIDVHNSVQLVTVGIAFSNPSLAIPDVMLLARPAGSHAVSARHDRDTKRRGLKSVKSLELTRLFPLKFVKLSIHNREKKQLRLKLATGRSFYLQLCPPADAKEDLFAQWEDLLFFLRPPVEAYSGMQAEPAGDMMDIALLEAEDRRSPEAMEVRGEGYLDQVSIRSIYILTEVSGATSPAHAAGEGVQPHASRTHCVLRSTDSVLTTAPVGPAPGTSPRAAVTPAGSKSVVAGAVVTSIPGRETLGGPGLRPSISALHRKDNTGEQDEGRRASQPQAEALRKRRKEAEGPSTSTSHSGRKWEDQSVLVSHGTTQGHQRDKGRSNLSIYKMGPRLSQKLTRSESKTRTEGVP